jgi:putative solute:sodium symporter small subunit
VSNKLNSDNYWQTNIRLVLGLLSIWFTVSYLFGIVLVEWLNQWFLGGFPLGFWFAQQGSIIVFIALILAYCLIMDRIDAKVIQNSKEE